MIARMHYCGATVLEKFGSIAIRSNVAKGAHLATLAWSDSGPRSHFWAPLSTSRSEDDDMVLDGSKSMVTSAAEADSYAWSTYPTASRCASTLWLVASHTASLNQPNNSNGIGLRGNVATYSRIRDARAASVIAPTSDAQYEFIGKTVCSMPVFG